jgi:hypothetical protein
MFAAQAKQSHHCPQMFAAQAPHVLCTVSQIDAVPRITVSAELQVWVAEHLQFGAIECTPMQLGCSTVCVTPIVRLPQLQAVVCQLQNIELQHGCNGISI